MSQYLIDCNPRTDVCTMVPYTAPPATVDHYALAPPWAYALASALILVFIIATAIVRYKAHEEREHTKRQAILNPPKQCPTCGDKLEAIP